MIHEIENPVIMKATIEVVEFLKKTTAKGWKDVKVGDIIDMTTKIQSNQGASNGYYQTYIKLENKTQNFTFGASLVEFAKYTKTNFKIKQIS